jgi:hypothetical protein
MLFKITGNVGNSMENHPTVRTTSDMLMPSQDVSKVSRDPRRHSQALGAKDAMILDSGIDT